MTSRRAYNAFRKMRPGSIGGQSRIASPVSPASFAKPVGLAPAPGAEPTPEPEPLLFDALSFADNSTTSMSAFIGDLTYESGNLLLNYLVSIGADPPTVSFEDDWFLRLDDSAFVSGSVQLQTKVGNASNDGLFWEWASTAAAISVSVAVLADGYDYVDSWYDQEIGTPSMSLGAFTSGGSHIIIFLWSESGSTVDGADLIHRSETVGAGTLEAWHFDTGSISSLTGDALSGNLIYVSAVGIG